MQFKRLTLRNIGVFRGEHTFNLSPAADGRHITVITGHNGAGKTTLFRAISFALHGLLAVGERVSQRDYNQYLLDLLHRQNTSQGVTISSEGMVQLELEIYRSGSPITILATRMLERGGNTVRDLLDIKQHGIPVDTHDTQGWINDLLPPNISPVCFFDAEALGSLIGAETRSDTLKEALQRLLGLHLVDRLESDLYQYTLKLGGGANTEKLKRALLDKQSLLDTLDAQLERLTIDIADLRDRQAAVRDEIEQNERRLRAEGGGYAERRPKLQQELEQLEKEIGTLTQEIGENAETLLPFTLAPKALAALEKRLENEEAIRNANTAEDVWQKRSAKVMRRIGDASFWSDLPGGGDDVAGTISEKLQRVFDSISEQASENVGGNIVHDLSSSELRQLRAWITEATGGYRQYLHELGRSLQEKRERQMQIEKDLRRAPRNEVLKPVHKELTQLRTERDFLQENQEQLNRKLGELRKTHNDELQEYERRRKRFEAAMAGKRGSDLAIRSQSVLRNYRGALVQQRLEMLGNHLVEAFNLVCRKDHLLTSAEIDSGTFSIELRGKNGHTVNLDDFSAGERQLFSLSLFRALREITGYALPLFIDTPFARLDEVHRQRLVERYLPKVSSQVVLFATDAEHQVMTTPKLHPSMVRAYHLIYDREQQSTIVEISTYSEADLMAAQDEVVHAS